MSGDVTSRFALALATAYLSFVSAGCAIEPNPSPSQSTGSGATTGGVGSGGTTGGGGEGTDSPDETTANITTGSDTTGSSTTGGEGCEPFCAPSSCAPDGCGGTCECAAGSGCGPEQMCTPLPTCQELMVCAQDCDSNLFVCGAVCAGGVALPTGTMAAFGAWAECASEACSPDLTEACLLGVSTDGCADNAAACEALGPDACAADGCGGNCGKCVAPEWCNAGQCTDKPLPGEAQCVNEQDLAAHAEQPVGEEALNCGLGCLGLASDCFLECVSDKVGLTAPCSQCYHVHLGCIFNNCVGACATAPGGAGCIDCALELGCTEAFQACGGIDPAYP